jgi:hypothetical protein
VSRVLSQLETIVSKRSCRQAIIFVPSQQYGVNLGTALARRGRSWANLRFRSPAELASRIAEAGLLASGKAPLHNDALYFVLRPILEHLIASEEGSYLAELGVSRGLIGKFAATIHALRMAGVPPGDEKRDSSDRSIALRSAYRAYCRALEERRLYDEAGLLQSAIEAPVPRLVGKSDFYVLDSLRLSRLEERFIRHVAGDGLIRVSTEAESPPPRRMAGTVFATSGVVDPGDTVAEPQLRIATAVGAETAVRGILRDILSRGVSYDDVEIAYTAEHPYLAAFVALSERPEEAPLTFTYAQGVPVRLTRPGLALSALIGWAQAEYGGPELISMLRSGLLTFGRSRLSDVDPVSLARFVSSARLAGGRRRFQNVTPSDARRARVDGDTSASMSAALATLATVLPDPLDTTTIDEVARRCIGFLNDFVSPFTPRDAHVIESIEQRLGDLARAIPEPLEAGEIIAVIAEMLATHKVEASSARPGAIHVTTVERAGFAGRSQLYVLGMEESNFPGTILEDPLLLDEERSRLGASLQSDRPAETTWSLERAMRAGATDVLLIAVTRSTSDGRELYPSPFFEQVRANLSLAEHEVPFWSIVPRFGAVNGTERQLMLRESAEGPSAIRRQYPALEFGRRAAERRLELDLSIYDGLILDTEPPLPRWALGSTSASMFERLAACPYKHFLSDVLGLRRPDEFELQPSMWLDARAFGSLLHGVLYEFMQKAIELGWPRGGDFDVLMDSVVERQIDYWKTEVPPPNTAAFERQRIAVVRAASAFLEAEARLASAGHRPVALEQDFGPLNLEIGGRTIPLSGRIDRVDESPAGVHVWDYKSGSSRRYRADDLIANGTRLQWALYARAFEALTGEDVATSGYYFINAREAGRRIEDHPPSLDALSVRLRPLLEMVDAGWFPKVQKTDACGLCDFKGICSAERIGKQQWKKVSGNVDHPELVATIDRWMEAP